MRSTIGTTADEFYQHALKLAPKEARVINNQGWSMLLRGDWAAAVPLFQQAVALDPNSVRIANNLELAKSALAADLPRRRPGEANADWAARLNDAGVAAELLGDKRAQLLPSLRLLTPVRFGTTVLRTI